MNILHLEASSGWGGQEMRILKEAEGMRDRGHTIALGVMQGGLLIQRARDAGFVVFELNFHKSGWLLCLFQILRIVRRHRIDLVNTHSSLDAWIGGIAARIANTKILRTRHLSTPIKPGWNSRVLYGALADFVVTTCASILPAIVQQSKKPLSQCRSVPTGIDPHKITYAPQDAAALRASLGIKQTDFLVGTACFMRSWKGINDLLLAAHLLREIPDLRWVVIGGGHAAIHHKKAAELHLEGIVHFTGHLENPFAALGSLDVFTLLSTANEGVSQAILQAAFLGKPLIATPTGGLGEVCIDGKTGLQVPPFSPARVADAVLGLKNNAPLRAQLGSAASALAAEHFTLQRTLDQMADVYTKICPRVYSA